MIVILTLLIGLFLILAEFYLPGGIMAILGGGVLICNIILFALSSESIIWTILYTIGVIIATGFVIKFALWKIPRNKSSRSVYLSGDQQGFQASSFDASVIGKRGIVLTDLKPGGHILVDGKRLQAISESGYLVKGTSIEVLSGQEDSLIVKRVKEGL